MAFGPITSQQIEGEKVETVTYFLSLGSKITADGHCSLEIKRHLLFGRKVMTNLDTICIKKPRHLFADKGLYIQSYGFSSSRVWMWELGCKEDWVLNNWCFQIVVLEETLLCPLDSKEIKPVNPKGNQPWIFIGRTDAEVAASIIWSPNVKSTTHWKRPWCWERLKAKGEEGSRS